jgi:PPK2 family polyphosphate:nucleotide phosphotransferase
MSGLGHLVRPDSSVSLHEFDPSDTGGLNQDEGTDRLAKATKKLERLQELLYAAGTHSALIVLQGPDTAGKDGTIRLLSTCLNVQHTSVSSFKVPNEVEAGHDFLWRIHRQTPGRGQISIFNRSHYEDVLVVRVHELVAKPVWKERYGQINAFEDLLADSGTIVRKFFLHISREEQEKRLRAREEDKEKAWKLSVADWKERAYWDDYLEAYEAALSKCSPKHAPWTIVPSNHKWFRNLCVVERLVEAFEGLEGEWMRGLEARGRQAEAALQAFRAGTGH